MLLYSIDHLRLPEVESCQDRFPAKAETRLRRIAGCFEYFEGFFPLILKLHPSPRFNMSFPHSSIRRYVSLYKIGSAASTWLSQFQKSFAAHMLSLQQLRTTSPFQNHRFSCINILTIILYDGTESFFYKPKYRSLISFIQSIEGSRSIIANVRQITVSSLAYISD